jgi:uncharacterized membrane protein SpoIIM required for sporulation
VIIDLERFLEAERPHWEKLEERLRALEADPHRRMSLPEILELHTLYQRASADLGRVATSSFEPGVRLYLESLVARAYGEIQESRRRPHRLAPWRFLSRTFPRVFRRHLRAFGVAVLITFAGCAFGGGAILVDPPSREALLPFDHLREDPGERVAGEERTITDRLQGVKTTFSAFLMANNIRVAILCMALGASWGIGTAILLFSNGLMLGAVLIDYVQAGQTRFVLGWLLPHGSIEIPAFIIAGQAGLVLAGALIGWGDRTPLKARLRQVTADLVTLIAGVAALLVWAGFIESFLSQYHEPILPYSVKIGFGAAEFLMLALFLSRAGRKEIQAQGPEIPVGRTT